MSKLLTIVQGIQFYVDTVFALSHNSTGKCKIWLYGLQKCQVATLRRTIFTW